MKDWPKAADMAWLKVNDEVYFGILTNDVLTHAVLTENMNEWILRHNIGTDTASVKTGGGSIVSPLSGTEVLDFANSLGVMKEAKKYTAAYAENDVFSKLLRD